jgi:hypothetical protein
LKVKRLFLAIVLIVIVFLPVFIREKSALVNAQSSFDFYVKNVNGNYVADGRGIVMRYTSNWVLIDQATTDSQGKAVWSNISPGTYNFETYYNGPGGQEFWGDVSVTVSSSSTSYTFTRFMPYCIGDAVWIGDTSGNAKTSFKAGETVRTKFTLKNNCNYRLSCRVNGIWDEDQLIPWDFDQNTTVSSVAGAGGVQDLTLDYAIPSNTSTGTMRLAYWVWTQLLNGHTTVTDSWNWTSYTINITGTQLSARSFIALQFDVESDSSNMATGFVSTSLLNTIHNIGVLLQSYNLTGTFFVQGACFDNPTSGTELRNEINLLTARNEIESHFYSHLQNMSSQSASVVLEELSNTERAAGMKFYGARVPYFDVSTTILKQLAANGYLYDSDIWVGGDNTPYALNSTSPLIYEFPWRCGDYDTQYSVIQGVVDNYVASKINMTIVFHPEYVANDWNGFSQLIQDIATYKSNSNIDVMNSLQTINAIFGISQPDLAVNSADITAASIGSSNNTFQLRAVIHNIGGSKASNISVGLYDGDPSQGSNQIGSFVQIGQLDSGLSTAISTSWTTTPGSHRVYISVDPFDAIPERDKTNNIAYANVVINSSQPTNQSGSISITLLDSSGDALTPETLILYNSSYQEISRVSPPLNTYTFSSLPQGTYNVEAYVDDMSIGSVNNVTVLAGQTVSRTIQASWFKQTLTVTVYYSDGTTPLSGATIEVFSWDELNQLYSLRSSVLADSTGKASFLLWPTIMSAEHYELQVTYSSSQIGEEQNVKVDQYNGASVTITTSLALSPPSPSRFSPTVNGYNFDNNIAKETVSFSDANNALSSCPWASSIPAEARPLIAMFAVGVQQLQFGNCFGMCYTAKYYYENPSAFASKYSGFGDMYGVDEDTASPEILVNQFPGQEIMQPYLFNLALTYLGLNSLNDEIRWIMGECDNYRPVQLYLTALQNNPFFLHSVIVYDYRLSGNTLTLYIYDPNHSGTTCYIEFSRDQKGDFALTHSNISGDLVSEYGLTNIGAGEFIAVDWNLLSAHMNELVQLVWELMPKISASFLGTKLSCPVNMLIRASNGSRVGYDWTTAKMVNELKGVFYSGNATDPQVIVIPDPDNSSYTIMLSGTAKGNYTLTVERYDQGQLIGLPSTVNGEINAGQLKEYTLQLVGNAGPSIEETPAGINIWLVGTVVTLIIAFTLFAVYYRKYRRLSGR